MAKRKPKPVKIAFNRIKDVLEEQQKSQTWLAEQLDMDFQTVTRYVNNHRQPTVSKLFEIAKILKVNPRDLLDS
jgi:putative transcriptional regulator